MKIIIETIPHLQQRYNTCGDWQFDSEGNLTLRISEFPKVGLKASYLVAIHELVEALLCQEQGITTEMVDAFDTSFDPLCDQEPGDSPRAPYKREHCIATGIERILATEFGVDWVPYEEELYQLTLDYEQKNG